LINKPFSEINRKDIEEQMRVNFEAPLLLVQALLPFLKRKKGKSHVVNIGSMGGYQGSEKFPGLSVYSASKGGLAILTECLATEFASDNIAFNCLALGSADTEMLRKAFPKYKSPISPQQMADFIVNFALTGHRYFNGKIIPVATLST
jgi:NAD(P)-dependent dehydrogenase (short-subunit alcohol dehydrogenase family)